ncbi:SDR family NAD(P)-dependent oxidoreductase [Roseateles oligotrophus]|uniref:SDR family NAD(P)-dependent oxidoreductase n=1 Tax=Roseateles oligotrophus TaxID=1769250 RepID=A0ABT2YJV1_9BURK|nr:SDR family NAD(P)-dependent oxidoreductase [Roseateles oligotrophus]MCV2370331.1 SDR family NAD(P)-dependent oxidoreductase [Roseateles oligotrophus]
MSLNPKITHWQGRIVWLIGASSGIGQALAHSLHLAGARVLVSARQVELLQTFVAEHPGSLALPLDVLDAPALKQATQSIVGSHGRIDLTIYCAGYYQAMQAQNFSLAEAKRHIEVNYVGALNLLDALLPQLLLQAHQGCAGHLSLVSSVAGFRGLPKSLAYGPSKAALSHLAEALYLDLSGKGIGVSVIHPGFVETPLTAQNDFKMPALISPDAAAQAIIKGWRQGKFEIHFPKRFTFWLKALRLLGHGSYFALIRKLTQT